MSATLQSLRTAGLVPALMARAPALLSLLLVALLGIRAALLIVDLTAPPRRSLDAAVQLPPLPAQTDLPSLIGANLFGAAGPSQSALPGSTLPLVLVGVLAATDPGRGVAILGPTAEAAKVHLVGSVLPGGARLAAVHVDRVVIERGGSLESLALPRQSPASGQGQVAPQPAAAERAQQLVQQNPAAITNVMRPQAVLVDGKQKGYRVFPGANRQAFARLGLQAGDLVTAINGTPLDDPASGANVFGTLATSPNARVSIVRDGRPQDVLVNVAQAITDAERTTQAPPAAEPASIPPP